METRGGLGGGFTKLRNDESFIRGSSALLKTLKENDRKWGCEGCGMKMDSSTLPAPEA
jgi:hypothetical protein